PVITQLKLCEHKLKLAILKRYIEAVGGNLSLDVELPTGKHIVST
ncbi:transcriptional regulator, partial [Salmonella enterica subsp. enterica serovar Newport]|nr:transcriptional regulator [Salmonella enterica subsp. enterica serovar Newport]